MINKQEIILILLITILLSALISLLKSIQALAYILIAVFFVIFINILAKKITAYYLESEIQIKLWEIKYYGFKPKSYFKKPVPIGALLPIILSAITLGYITWFACLIFDVKPRIYRTAKRHGLYSFSEMTESHIALIAATGIFINLIFAIIGYLIHLPEFAKINIFYAFFNMLPISNLDGNKIFFGNLVLWVFLALITLIGIGYVFLLV